MVARSRGVKFAASFGTYGPATQADSNKAWQALIDVATWLGFKGGRFRKETLYQNALLQEKSKIFLRARA